MTRLRLVVLGTLASNPYAGMAWMHMQITAGLRRLGHDAYYFETTSTWPYDPIRHMGASVGRSSRMAANRSSAWARNKSVSAAINSVATGD